jgi:hypothetical protein
VLLCAAADGDLDLAQVFVIAADDLAGWLDALRGKIRPTGMIWVSWPKRSARLPTDITEDVVRGLALARGLVDVKVCAVGAIWSGLKLVIPLAQRGRRA